MPQCERCNEPFDPKDSDSADPSRYCGRDCQQDAEDRRAALANDAELVLDHDHTLDG